MPLSILPCPYCPKTSSRGTGLASHIRGSHPVQYSVWLKSRKLGVPAVAAAKPVASVVSGSGFGDIVARLEQQKKAIETALAALRGIGDAAAAPEVAAPSAPKAAPAGGKRKGAMSPEGKARLIEAQKRRWAKQKAAQAVAPAVKKTSGKPGRPRKA